MKAKDDELRALRSEMCMRQPPTHFQHPSTRSEKSSSSDCVQAIVLRAERERDVIQAELDRMRYERDSVREKLHCCTQTHLEETQRYQQRIEELNARLLHLEKENRDVNSARIPGQTQVILLKEEMEELKRRLFEFQNENCQLKTANSQLKFLQDQTERALVEYQNKFAVSETHLETAENRLNAFGTNCETSRNENSILHNEIAALKSTYVKLEHEKDKIVTELDAKTEKVYQLEYEMKTLKDKKNVLEQKVQELRQRLDMQTNEERERETELHETSTESKALRQQISTLKQSREKAIAENSRLAGELADSQSDILTLKRKFKDSEKEVCRLSDQVKKFVQEVKRAEDLLSLKDLEREEMLEHYRSLSHDAVILEGNNMSLENESVERKRLLSEAEDAICHLKCELRAQNGIIEKLEKEISTITAQNSTLVKELEQAYDEQRLLKVDLDARKELCDKLDLQKDKLNAELAELGGIRRKLEQENKNLRKDTENNITGALASTETLEKLLQQTRHDLEEQINSQCKLSQELIKMKQENGNLEKMLLEERDKRRFKEALANEYDVQNRELRHNITDDLFRQARSREQSPRDYPTI